MKIFVNRTQTPTAYLATKLFGGEAGFTFQASPLGPVNRSTRSSYCHAIANS